MAQRKFSLAAALWDFHQADDCAAPTHSAPETWRVLFESKHVDQDVCSGMLPVSFTCKQWALQRAKTATLHVDCTGSKDDISARQRRVKTLKQDLAVRGALPTTLTVTYDRARGSLDAVASCAEALGQGTHKVTAFALQRPPMLQHLDWPVVEALPPLVRVVAALPTITSLAIDTCGCPLPYPAHLKHIRHLSLTIEASDDARAHATCRSIAALLQQLTSLKVGAVFRARPSKKGPQYDLMDHMTMWEQIFTARTTTLTHFTTCDHLSNRLLTLLVRHVPELRQLSVGGVFLQSMDMSDEKWLVERLCPKYTDPKDGRVVQSVAFRQLMWLPIHKQGRAMEVGVSGEGVLVLPTVRSSEGFSGNTMSRIQDFDFHVQTVSLVCGDDLKPNKQPTALRNVLRQLRQLKAPASTMFEVQEWAWSPATLPALATAASEEPHLRLSVTIRGPLTNQLLGGFLQCGTAVVRLAVDSLGLQSDQHANASWPWEELVVRSRADMVQLMRLPDASKASKVPEIQVTVKPLKHVVDQVTAERHGRWLSHVSITPYHTFKRGEPPSSDDDSD